MREEEKLRRKLLIIEMVGKIEDEKSIKMMQGFVKRLHELENMKKGAGYERWTIKD